MYKIYIFTYRGSNKLKIFEVIKAGIAWYKFDESSYILCTNLTTIQIYNEISHLIDSERDNFLFMQIDIKHYKGRLPSEVWVWIKKQIAKTKRTNNS